MDVRDWFWNYDLLVGFPNLMWLLGMFVFSQVTFLVTHFSDARIANSDVRDMLLQSISVLVQYKEHVVAFERSQAAREELVGCLLASFDNRFWIPVSNILLRLCKGSGFGASKCMSHGESFSPHFQVGSNIRWVSRGDRCGRMSVGVLWIGELPGEYFWSCTSDLRVICCLELVAAFTEGEVRE